MVDVEAPNFYYDVFDRNQVYTILR